MSATTTPAPTAPATAPQTVRTNAAINAAESGAALLNNLQTADPALYAQLVGSVATYGKSAAAPLVGSLLGLFVAHYGLGPYVTPDTLTFLTDALVGLGTVAGAAIMHWLSKAPARKMAAPPAAGSGVGV